MANEDWPALPLDEWQETCSTLHMWTQVIGKVRLALTPLVNHWWNVPLYVSARGLNTSAMPYRGGTLEIEFDFVAHRLLFRLSDGTEKALPLRAQTVAEFYRDVMKTFVEFGEPIEIWPVPVEVPDPIPFEQDDVHRSYDAAYAHRFWRVLTLSDRVFKEFRASFTGKCSPVHFFWGSFDLAVTRFSGRRAPEREGADIITREAYSHEVISHGFWPGGPSFARPAYYSYTAPEPEGLKEARVLPAEAYYSRDLSEFILHYDDVRGAASPEASLMDFLHSTYEAGANLAGWDRAALERS
jgi:hypothetical protein